MKNLLPALLLLAMISCKKSDDYSYEGGHTPPVTQVSSNAPNPSDSGVLNDLDVLIKWYSYDDNNKITYGTTQGSHTIIPANSYFSYPYFELITADTLTHCYVEWYRNYPAQKPSDLLLRKAVELNHSIPFVPERCELADVKLIRITQ